ncbi:MAG: phosphate signaling complex protein PhoU [bacterium]|nr:phosphate signaling complex protein PhoU [bacterium]
MARHMFFHREIDKIKRMILELGIMVEERLRRACMIIHDTDTEAEAEELINSDWQVDDMEVRVEEECLKLMALHQPVARDLRLLVVIIKINNELERIADIAVNIAKRVQTINKKKDENFAPIVDYGPMAAKALAMLKISLNALVTEDGELARQLFFMDEEVNDLRDKAYQSVVAEIQEQPGNTASLLNLYLIARHLERVGDRAKNIAEEVIYLVDGEIIRNLDDTDITGR